MLFNQFINRQHELKQLASFFAQSSQASKVLFVSGKSGVGKSQLTAEFVRKRGIRPAIRVACPVPSFDKTVKDGIFIRNLSEQVNQCAETEDYETITAFANRLGASSLVADYEHKLLEDGRKFTLVTGFNALRTIIQRKRRRLQPGDTALLCYEANLHGLAAEISDSHILWNNVAASEMMAERFKERQKSLLEHAKLTSALAFDHIVTNNNLALWHANVGNLSEALRLLSAIDGLVEAETDHHLRCAVFFNRSAVLLRSGHKAENTGGANPIGVDIVELLRRVQNVRAKSIIQ
jgi:hypothetical protein